MDLGFEIQKTNLGIRIRILKIRSASISRQNGQIWLFWPKFGQKWIFSSKLRKHVEIRVSILKIPCMPTFRQNGQLWTFGPKFRQKWILGQNFKNLNLDSESASLIYFAYQFSDKTDNFEFLGPNLPQNGFCGQNFKNQSLDSESASWNSFEYQFSDKTDNFEFLGPNFLKLNFGVKFSKIQVLIRNQHLQYTTCANFESKWTTFNFLA